MPKKHAIDAKRFDAFLLDPDAITIPPKGHSLHRDRYPDEALILSVMAFGVKEPVLVTREGDAILVVAGQRRVLAAREANKRLKKQGKEPLKVKAVIERGEEADLFGIMVVENQARTGDAAMTIADNIRKYLAFGRTEEEAAVAFAMPVSGVKQHLALFDVGVEVRSAVKNGVVSVTAAAKLAKLDKKKQVAALAELTKGGKKVTVRRTMRAAKGEDPDEAVNPPSKHEIGMVVDRLRELKKNPQALHESAVFGTTTDALLWVLDGVPRGVIADVLKVGPPAALASTATAERLAGDPEAKQLFDEEKAKLEAQRLESGSSVEGPTNIDLKCSACGLSAHLGKGYVGKKHADCPGSPKGSWQRVE